MPKPTEKHSQDSLDLFVLALIDSGVSNPSELQKATNFSEKTTISSFKRLFREGYIVEDERGQRFRIPTITSDGWYYLKNGWRDLIADGPSGAIDTDLQVALVALWAGADRRLAVDFMNRSGEKRLGGLGQVQEEVELAELPHLAFWYKRLRVASAEAILNCESAATLAITKNLPKSQFANHSLSRKLPRSK